MTDLESQYRAKLPQLESAARSIESLLRALLDDEEVNYQSVEARAKTPESFVRKAGRKRRDDAPKYAAPLEQITDQVAARVVTFVAESVQRTCDIIDRELVVIEREDKGARTRAQGQFGYSSRHFLARLKDERARLPEYAHLASRVFEIQVRTVAQHAWAEYEHDVRYKFDIPEGRKPEFDRRFTLAAGLLELADAEFTAIEALYTEVARATPVQDDTSDPLDLSAFVRWVTARYPQAPQSRSAHYAWMLDVVREVVGASVSDLERVLASVDSDAVARAMGHRLPPGHVRRLDDDLLAALGNAYIERAGGDAGRAKLLRARQRFLER